MDKDRLDLVMDLFLGLQNTMLDLNKEILKFTDKKNKAAGSRARKELSNLAKKCKSLRQAVQEAKNS